MNLVLQEPGRTLSMVNGTTVYPVGARQGKLYRGDGLRNVLYPAGRRPPTIARYLEREGVSSGRTHSARRIRCLGENQLGVRAADRLA